MQDILSSLRDGNARDFVEEITARMVPCTTLADANGVGKRLSWGAENQDRHSGDRLDAPGTRAACVSRRCPTAGVTTGPAARETDFLVAGRDQMTPA
jgi:hypothetical protein